MALWYSVCCPVLNTTVIPVSDCCFAEETGVLVEWAQKVRKSRPRAKESIVKDHLKQGFIHSDLVIVFDETQFTETV